jgi:hypothetical protein
VIILEKWEYMSMKVETKGFTGGILDTSVFDSNLNSLGNEGWELVSCFSTNREGGQSREIISVLKRKKSY